MIVCITQAFYQTAEGVVVWWESKGTRVDEGTARANESFKCGGKKLK